MVYDIDVDRTHNFVANGIVTHNSIYKFRGVDFRNLLKFEEAFPEAAIVVSIRTTALRSGSSTRRTR